MFNRSDYKKAAKAQLKGRRLIPVLTTFLCAVILGIFGSVSAAGTADSAQVYSDFGANGFRFGYHNGSPFFTVFSFLLGCVAAAFFLAQKNVFCIMQKDSRKIVFADFITGLNQWWQAVRGFFWYGLWVYLWTLLFIIPGIIKHYSYSMMFYVMAENPKIKVTKAMNISKELTRGYKGDLFVTDLSFAGWFFLCCLSGGIGFFWLIPYYQMTLTNVYQELKQVALKTGRISEPDFQ